MFSIARYEGENHDEQQDQRTLETKKQRLNNLLSKVNKKRKQPEQDASPAANPQHNGTNTQSANLDGTVHHISKSTKKKKKEKKPSMEATDSAIQPMDHEESTPKPQDQVNRVTANIDPVIAMDTSTPDQHQTPTTDENGNENKSNDEKTDETATEKPIEEEAALERFPDLVTINKQSKEDIEMLRNMGIPEWLLQPTTVTPDQSCSLDEVGLSSSLVQRCQDQGLSSFFAVQMQVIPAFLRRQALYDTRRAPGDLCVSAPTGSGKTLAYVLPIVDILSKRIVTRLRALVILPTRDLVIQVKETFDAFVKGTDLKVGIALGQHSFIQEQGTLVGKFDEVYTGGLSKVDILIATPGRLMDHLKDTPNFTLQHLRFLVIDEADKLLNQSYQDWLNHILQASQPPTNKDKLMLGFKTDKYSVVESDGVAPSFMASNFDLPSSDFDLPKAPSVQKLLFSATLTKNPGKIAGLHLTEPEYISVQRQGDDTKQPQYTTPAGLEEYMLVCATDKKPLMVVYLLQQLNIKSGLCFTKSVESTRQLKMLLNAYSKQTEMELNVVEYSSDLKAARRKALLQQFKDGEIDLMICSDLIGRGIDMDCVQVVISYDVPLFMDKYIHRVGRTARAGREGKAFTLVEKQEARHFKGMLRSAGHYHQVKTYAVDKEQIKSYEEGYQTALAELSQDN